MSLRNEQFSLMPDKQLFDHLIHVTAHSEKYSVEWHFDLAAEFQKRGFTVAEDCALQSGFRRLESVAWHSKAKPTE